MRVPYTRVFLSAAVFVLLISLNAQAQSKTDPSIPQELARAEAVYSCQQADELKFNKEKFSALDLTNRSLVNAVWEQCDLKTRRARGDKSVPDQEVAVFPNPSPTPESSRVFYGLVDRKDLKNAEKNCAGAGKAAGFTLVVVGVVTGVESTGKLGTAVYNYSGSVCNRFKSEVEQNNLMVLLGPTQIVSHAVSNKITHEVFDKIPLVSRADKDNVEKLVSKATAPPQVTVDDKNVHIKTPLGGVKTKWRPF